MIRRSTVVMLSGLVSAAGCAAQVEDEAEEQKVSVDVQASEVDPQMRWWCSYGWDEDIIDCRSGTCHTAFNECSGCSWWENFFFGGCWMGGS